MKTLLEHSPFFQRNFSALYPTKMWQSISFLQISRFLFKQPCPNVNKIELQVKRVTRLNVVWYHYRLYDTLKSNYSTSFLCFISLAKVHLAFESRIINNIAVLDNWLNDKSKFHSNCQYIGSKVLLLKNTDWTVVCTFVSINKFSLKFHN